MGMPCVCTRCGESCGYDHECKKTVGQSLVERLRSFADDLEVYQANAPVPKLQCVEEIRQHVAERLERQRIVYAETGNESTKGVIQELIGLVDWLDNSEDRQ